MFEIALAAQILVWLTVFAWFTATKQVSLFHPSAVYLGFHGLVFVLRPILVYYLGFDSIWKYIGFEPSEADMIKTLAVTSTALLVFVGTNLFFGRARADFPVAPASSFTSLQRTALVVTTAMLLPLIAYSIYKTAFVGVVGERAANGVYIMVDSTGYINDAQWMIAPLLCVWLLMTRFHWINFLLIVPYIAYRSWCGWARFTILTLFIAIMLAYCWQNRKKWVPARAIALAIPILILFNTLGHNRDYFQSFLKGEPAQAVSADPGTSQFDKFRLRADTQDFANFDYLTFVLSVVPERTGTYTYGAQYLQLFTEPIPRILWRGKPAGAPIRNFDINAFGNFLGLTFSLAGDGWSSGGWIGLVITVGVVASLLGLFHRWFWRNVNNPVAAAFYCTAVSMFIQWFRDGGISIAKFMLWAWLPLLIWQGVAWVMGGARVPATRVALRPGDRLVFKFEQEQS